ncbi:MAG TPA: phenylalanine--tRNA ligase subunit alpha [Chitinophagales bacterium]|nr:phenylalanine--tRNA ligase subunit alpha [Chitinophagales bacterium]
MDSFQKAEELLKEIKENVISGAAALEQFRIRFMGSKNIVKDIMADMKNIPSEKKKEFGQLVNTLKQKAEEKYNQIKEQLQSSSLQASEAIDLTRPADSIPLGSRHPVSIVRKKIIDIFSRIGFTVAEGPEIENEWYNFTALNTPQDHPARDMTDTFYIQTNPEIMLRSQTSNVQIRTMEKQKPPIRIIAPGRVYRNETITYKSHVFFHQVEGLYVDKNVSFADLKQTIVYFIREFFGEEYDYRIRPSYFPFTEVSAEVDIRKKGTNKWMEILGSGMVHPQVLRNCNIDPEVYTGFAFGMGIERPTLLKYGITDIRVLFENDWRFLEQFTNVW